MDKELTYKHIGCMWIVVLTALALLLMVANRDYADKHKWIVEHSEIPLNNK